MVLRHVLARACGHVAALEDGIVEGVAGVLPFCGLGAADTFGRAAKQNSV
jgi:hypothetical protein